MNTIEIPERGIKLSLPEHLGGCNEREYAAMSRLLFDYQAGKMDYHAFRNASVYVLLDLEQSKKERPETDRENMEANIFQVSELIDSFFSKTEDGKMQIRQEYQHNPIPVIDTGFHKYHGPSDYMESATFGEYVDGLNVFLAFNESGDISLLYDLCAIFYRGRGNKYRPEKVHGIAKKLKFADFGKIYGFYLFFASFQHYLTSAVVFWEGRELDLSILFKQTSKDGFTSALPSLGMKATSYMLAESGVLGNLKEVNETSLWEVLLLMYDIKKSDIDNSRRMEEAKNK